MESLIPKCNDKDDDKAHDKVWEEPLSPSGNLRRELCRELRRLEISDPSYTYSIHAIV